MPTKGQIANLLIALMGFAGCQREEVVPSEEIYIPSDTSISVEIPIRLGGQSLSLTGTVESISVLVDGCTSGFSRTIQTNWGPQSLHLMEGDHDCKAAVASIAYDGQTFSLASSPFQTDEGSTNNFISPSGRHLQVVVQNQLSDRISSSGDNIRFFLVESQRGSAQIIDNLTFNIVSIVATDVDFHEGEVASFMITREGSLTQARTVHLRYGGTALVEEDYATPPSSIIIPAGQNTVVLNISLVDDDASEFDETLEVGIVATEDVIPIGTDGFTTIRDNDFGVPVLGLIVQMNPTSFVRNGATISRWDDLAALGDLNNATQKTTSAQPKYIADGIGGLAAAEFDRSNDRLQIASHATINAGGPYTEKTIVVVFQTGANITSNQIIYEQGEGLRGLNLHISSGDLYFTGWNTNNDDGGLTTPWGPLSIGTAVTTNTNYLARLVFSATAGTITAFVNGLKVGEVSGVGRLFSQTGITSLGRTDKSTYIHSGQISAGAYFGGRMAEVLHYNGPLSDREGQSIDQTFLTKYGMAQPQLVWVKSNVSSLVEGGVFTVTVERTYATSSAATVQLTRGGSAIVGDDYEDFPTTVVIPADSRWTSFNVYTLDDLDASGNLELTLTPEAGEGFAAGAGVSVMIEDDESFNPHSSLIAWFDPSRHVTLVGSLVSDWANALGGFTKGSQATSSARPAFLTAGIRGLPALSFDGGDFLSVTSDVGINSGGPYSGKTISMVFTTATDITNRQVIWHQGNSTRGLTVYIQGSNLYWIAYNNKADDDTGAWVKWTSAPVAASTTYIASLIYDRPNSALRIRFDGNATSTVAGGVGNLFSHGTASGIGANVSSFRLHTGGTNNTTKRYFKGRLAEILYFNSALAGEDLALIENYLIEKYFP